MPVIIHANPGTVTGLWGSAFIRKPDGKLHPLQIGDAVQKGDWLLTFEDGIVELTYAELVKRIAVPAESIPELITALEKGDPQVIPGAAVVPEGTGLWPGDRVARIT